MLVKNYKKYYENSSSADNFKNLISSLINYNFTNYHKDIREIFDFYKNTNKKINKFEKLETNGSSTGTPKSYLFGPNCGDCIRNIEFFLRNKSKKTICITNIILGVFKKPLSFKKREGDKIADLVIEGEWSCESHIDELIKTMPLLSTGSKYFNI